jgi:hypothetical protein
MVPPAGTAMGSLGEAHGINGGADAVRPCERERLGP